MSARYSPDRKPGLGLWAGIPCHRCIRNGYPLADQSTPQ